MFQRRRTGTLLIPRAYAVLSEERKEAEPGASAEANPGHDDTIFNISTDVAVLIGMDLFMSEYISIFNS